MQETENKIIYFTHYMIRLSSVNDSWKAKKTNHTLMDLPGLKILMSKLWILRFKSDFNLNVRNLNVKKVFA